MFEASDVYVSYGKSRVINGMSVKIDKGEKIAILGRNGVGKTTFLKSIMGYFQFLKERSYLMIRI